MLFLSEGLTHADLVAMAQENYNLDMNTESMMRQLHAVYGEWLLKDGCWNFVVDHFKGARMLFLSEGSTHADLVAMAQDDYNLDMNTESVELTYSLQQSLYFVRRLPGSLLEDLLEVVWKTSWKLPGNRLEDFWEVV
ncbi:hypothetical protein F2Q70_00035913 [Brassica cretica]|uniref:Uncharacterized protein n=1 Tax=Brassica cretica TaxID=69181 RepID=A0A8S9JRD0_BRACR|nr:hypothetical protein F2Q70_00035913 [Brassica cretica]